MILCHVDFTIVSEQCSQNNVPIIKTNPFKVNIFVIILSLLLKIRTKIHITNTHNIQIKQTVLYFQV